VATPPVFALSQSSAATYLIGEGARKVFGILVRRTSGFAMQTSVMEVVISGNGCGSDWCERRNDVAGRGSRCDATVTSL
jgi:hypothetical protein